MPEHTHAKPRASRIPLDYFRHADFWTRWKGRLSLIAVIAGLGLVAWGMASPEARRAAGISEKTIRVSVGIEHPDDLVTDMKSAVDAIG